MVSIILADDHVVVRQGLRALLESDPNFAVVGEASNGLEAVEMVTRRKPTVLITDLMIPSLDGLAITQKLSRRKLDTQVIILSMYGDQAYVLTALKNGAAGYVLKESCGAELFQAIHEVVAGRRYISPGISEASIGSFSSMGTMLQRTQAGSKKILDTLTVREREVLRLLVEGGISSDIAFRLKISSHKLESYRATCMKKLDLKTHEDLIRYAVQRGSLGKDESKPTRKSRNTSGTLK
jgi:two-component system, NarL family, response regulator NreC